MTDSKGPRPRSLGSNSRDQAGQQIGQPVGRLPRRLDYLVSIPHFSKAWVSISGFPAIKDISMWNATRGFAALGNGKFGVYDLARSTYWTAFSLDSPYSGSV